MTVREQAAQLRDQGLNYREIAERVGVSKTTICRWLNPDIDERSRAACRAVKERYVGECELCGGPTNGCNGPGTAAAVCRKCLNWTPESIELAVRDFIAEYGRQPTAGDARADRGLPHFVSVARQYGSWNAMLDALGLPRLRDIERGPRVVVLAAAGHTLREIADIENTNPVNVRAILHYRGLRAPA